MSQLLYIHKGEEEKKEGKKEKTTVTILHLNFLKKWS